MSRVAPLPALDAAEMAKFQPWKQPWWRPARGDGPTFAWIMSIHIFAVVGLILRPIPGWPIFLAAAGLHFLGGLGTTVAFHRAMAHKSVRLNPFVRNLLTFFAMLNGSGSPLSWAANHRLHHAKSDTPEDISSPKIGGFWWSHLRWLWQAGPPPIKRYCKDLDTPTNRLWWRLQLPAVDDRALRAAGLRLDGLLLAGADSPGVRAARAVLREQRLPSEEGSRPRGHRDERALAVADALLPGRELAPESPRPPRLGAPRLDAPASWTWAGTRSCCSRSCTWRPTCAARPSSNRWTPPPDLARHWRQPHWRRTSYAASATEVERFSERTSGSRMGIATVAPACRSRMSCGRPTLSRPKIRTAGRG